MQNLSQPSSTFAARKSFIPDLAIRSNLVICDSILMIVAVTIAFFIRSDFRSYELLSSNTYSFLIIAIISNVAVGLFIGDYSYKYQLGSFEEALAMTSQNFIVFLIVSFTDLFIIDWEFPRSIPLIACTNFLFFAFVSRVIVRKYFARIRGSASKEGHNIVIYGVGDLGIQLANLLLTESSFNLVGFIDDSPRKTKMNISGKKVLGTLEKLEDIISKYGVSQLFVAIDNLSENKRIKLEEVLSRYEITIRDTSSVAKLIMGVGDLTKLIQDKSELLLGRPVLRIDDSKVRELLFDKVILITGAGGSIGSEIARQCNNFKPKSLYLLDRDEGALHSLELELYGTGLLQRENIVLADIRERESIIKILEDIKPDIVFHAAALKHMPLLERFPEEAIRTNVIGTKNILEACFANDVKLFINISTDKAAMPTSILGKTKLEAEVLTAGFADKIAENSNRKFLSVRFGNVIGSRGSVLHTFKFQIDHDLPITITDENVTRFFMTVSEAVNLVLESSVIGKNGEVLILDMGDPVNITNVARFLISQSGKDIPITFSGLRPGEKLHEDLVTLEEIIETRENSRIFHTKRNQFK